MRRLAVLSILAVLATPVAGQSHAAGQPVAASGGTASAHAPHWSYSGNEGPHAWGRLDPAWSACATGHEQSPIDLGPALKPHTARIVERFTPSAFVLFHNGHTVQAALEKASTLDVEGARYDAVQFHFHHPSEHTIAGKAYPAELHLVHKNAKGELAVLGILIAFGPTDNAAFEAIIAKLPRAAGDSVRFTNAVDLATLVDDHAGESEPIYSYHGSLTTPPCSEGVKWTVRARPILASFRQVQRLVAAIGESARPVQPVYDRR